jgi:hypothetical protein
VSDQYPGPGPAAHGERAATVAGHNLGLISTGDSATNVQHFYPPQRVSRLAIVSLILGVCGFLLVTIPFSVIFAIMALTRTSKLATGVSSGPTQQLPSPTLGSLSPPQPPPGPGPVTNQPPGVALNQPPGSPPALAANQPAGPGPAAHHPTGADPGLAISRPVGSHAGYAANQGPPLVPHGTALTEAG